MQVSSLKSQQKQQQPSISTDCFMAEINLLVSLLGSSMSAARITMLLACFNRLTLKRHEILFVPEPLDLMKVHELDPIIIGQRRVYLLLCWSYEGSI